MKFEPLHNQTQRDLWPSQVNGTLRDTARSLSTPDFAHLHCKGIKAMGFLCPGPLLRGTQLELSFCCLVIELFEGFGHLRFCYGKSRLKPAEKSALTLRVWSV